ncbi:MAG: hypothetical protein QHC79_09710 [Pseudosphingobacterium sp.]|nr:hypothetical protein [Pseudosphingobacterium sp.]
MAKITLKGIVQRVGKVETVGQNNETRKQSIIITVPAYVDAFGDKRGSDEEWSLDLLNDRIEQFNLSTALHGKKVVVEAYVGSQKISKSDGSEMYFINARLGKIEVYQPQQQNAQPSNNNW